MLLHSDTRLSRSDLIWSDWDLMLVLIGSISGQQQSLNMSSANFWCRSMMLLLFFFCLLLLQILLILVFAETNEKWCAIHQYLASWWCFFSSSTSSSCSSQYQLEIISSHHHDLMSVHIFSAHTHTYTHSKK